MKKITLSKTEIFYGNIDMPKNFEINRLELKRDILESMFLTNNRMSNNKLDYSYEDFKFNSPEYLYPLVTYLKDFYYLKYHQKLILEKKWANIYKPQESSIIRNTIDPLDLRNSPDFTLVYGVDVYDKNSKIIIEYDDNRRKDRTWHIPIKDNAFVMFPSILKYSINKNNSSEINTFLTLTFSYI